MKSLLDKSIHKYAGFVAFIFSMLIILLLLSIYTSAYASNIGVGFSRSIDGELSVGVQGEYETNKVDIEYLYSGIEFHEAKLDLAYRVSLFSWLDATVFQENDFTGYSLDKITRKNDLGLSAIVPVKDLDFELAIFGRNGKNPVAPSKEPGDYNSDTDSYPAIESKPGLTAVSGPHVSLATTFDVAMFEIEVKGLTNFAEKPTPQWLIDATTTGKIGQVDWTLSTAYSGQKHEGEYEDQFSSLLTFGINF